MDLAVALCHEFRRDFAIKLAMTILDAMELERLDKLYNLRLSAIEDCLERRQW